MNPGQEQITQYEGPWLVALTSVLPSVCTLQSSPSCVLLSLLIHSFVYYHFCPTIFPFSFTNIQACAWGTQRPGPALINHWRPEFANSILSTLKGSN